MDHDTISWIATCLCAVGVGIIFFAPGSAMVTTLSGAAFMALGLLTEALLVRCPHCHKRVGGKFPHPRTCPHCGGYIEW